MQVLKVDLEIKVLYKIIITVFYNQQNTPSFVAPLLYFVCVLNKHHCYCCFHTAPGESREETRVTPLTSPDLLSRLPPIHPPLAHESIVLHLCSVMWLSHVVRAPQGQQVFSWVTHTYMERHVCYTISYSKLACGLEKGGGLKMGFGSTQNVST